MSILVNAEVTQNNNVKYAIIEDNNSLTQTSTTINNFNVQGFVCSNSNCNSYSSKLWNGQTLNSGLNSSIILTYPQSLLSSGYGIIFYKDTYFPFEAKSNLMGNGNADDFNLSLTRKRNCEIPISNININIINQSVKINLTIDSPIKNAGPLNFIPTGLENYYSVDGIVNFTFYNSSFSDSTINTVTLPASQVKNVILNKNLSAGNYTINIQTYTNDIRCLNSIPVINNSQIIINYTNQSNNQTNNSIPFVRINSPLNTTYYNNSILVDIGTINATNVWFNYNNGANISYNSPINITFNNGSNVINAYANNSAGINWTSVVFYVNSSNNQNNQTNDTNTTIPFIKINNPEGIYYNYSNILINITAINASNVWFNWNGTNFTYVNPIYFNFSEGNNILTAFANNSIGINSSSVVFYVNSSNNGNNSDTTPPGAITNLHVQNLGENYINWVWNNPSDSDFKYNIIYIDGINVVNTSNNYYYLTELAASTTHTIYIETIDFSGNINSNGVSNTATTLKHNNGGGSGGESNNHRNQTLLGPYVAPTSELINGTTDDSVSISLDNKKVEENYSWFLVILMILILILLLLIIYYLMKKK